MRGPKPIPAHLKLVRGNPGRRPIKPGTQVAPSLPEPLPFLCDDAKAEWARVVPALYALRLLSKLDTAALAAYCVSMMCWAWV
jgi:phage terminase small subunit